MHLINTYTEFYLRLRFIPLTLEGWGYRNKEHLRGRSEAHLHTEMVLVKSINFIRGVNSKYFSWRC
jgi:hypothetical protein